jgi:uncharacterized membrane protein HdeD (DUF308 family)
MGFLGLLLLLLLVPVVFIIMGIVFLLNRDEATKKKGKNFLLAGILIALIEILIGYSMCSNLNIH